ncbi:MAG: energy transducer TonB [Wenzhouxiangella sp.]
MRNGWQATGGGDSLAMAAALALGLHAAVIGLVHFDVLTGARDAVPSSLDVILVEWSTREAPDEADFLAQVSQRGSGESQEDDRPAEPVPFSAEETEQAIEQEAAAPSSPEQSETSPDTLRMEGDLERPVLADLEEEPDTDRPDAAELTEQSRAMARVSSDRLSESRDFPERPRRKFISANTREHLYAAYMRSWVAKVERVGNLNYPEQARRRNLAGSLVLSVDVLEDGSVSKIRILESSGHDVLDEVAVRVVRLSAPFSELPDEIRSEVDVLTITRTWQFSSQGRLRGR